MSVTAGTISLVQAGSNSLKLTCTPASGGTGPYTYQWYMSTSTPLTPGGGNILAGKTSLDLEVDGLIPNVTYYFVLRATDTGASNATDDSSEFDASTTPQSLSQNQFAQTAVLGQLDMPYNFNTIPVQIDVSESGTLYAGDPIKIVDSPGGVPKVVKCTADSDSCFGFINYNVKNVGYVAGDAAEISQAGNVMWLYATGAIGRGTRVELDLVNGGVAAVSGSGGENIVGWAFDKATASGQLFRVKIMAPSFQFDS